MTAVVIPGNGVRPIARTGPKGVSVMEDVDTSILIEGRRRRTPGAWPASGPPP